MQITQAQEWVKDAWSRSEKRMSKLAELASFMEECGELGEAIRKIEHGKDKEVDLEKEMGDILLCLLTLAIRYDIDLQNAFDRTIEATKQKYLVK
ncbi:MAG: hypothetical protein GW914_01370 [Candidatus Aenigmarchaeota archaeon]|nr:hypothetical protein [Candidatus Aenigmarchaeota archaeon]PIV68787.1 MAG: hypothetical protein COS07_02980 [Candidatus Aenigmarchaeota archaeon CG01_land_8_20_14_3_00_37_9]PIW40773.1 MAG: hypothetical protein COW21_05420 [Candidatus Aenigmarchaeota archaeon CG15_BIG_FIL_POST_REV_8_21_14_020_37_27]PJB75780.1 MAG: hypothetical protein CO092_00950 [Candidatus Aenigmarchaeota archaeon CG_4_9_14_3_um_filter_37_18]